MGSVRSGLAAVSLALCLAAGSAAAAGESKAAEPSSPGDSFTLWQLPEQTHSQMLCYVLRTQHGKIAVIDGGMAGDAPYLRGFLGALGNRVDLWFVTHQHNDHTDALAALLRAPQGLKIGRIYGSFEPIEWISRYGEKGDAESDNELTSACATAATTVTEVLPGARMELDGVRFEILAGKNPELTTNAINNQSLVMRVSDARKSVLFTGDLGPEASEKVLKNVPAERLKADYIQMAHHGQNGATRQFYAVVAPKVCLWSTPRWLWDNDSGKGKGSGPWQTLVVRGWMEQLGVKENLVSADGLQRVD